MKYLPFYLFIFISTNVFSQSGTKNGAFDANNIDRLSINIDAGMTISITGSSENQITYDFDFDGNDQAYNRIFKNFDPKFTSNNSQASINIEFPKQTRRNANYRIKKSNLTIKVPKDIELKLETRYSKISIASISRTTEVNNRSGYVIVKDIGQGVSINNEYGNCEVESVNGDVNISSRSSTIDIKNVQGNLMVKSDYSKFNLSNISGYLDLENKSGTINAYDLDSNFISQGDYTNYELTDIRGEIKIENKSGNISIDKAESVSIQGDYTNVDALNLKGSQVFITGKSANIKLQNILGTTRINGSYLDIELSNLQKDVFIANRSGSVDAEELNSSFQFQGEYSNISLDKFLGDRIDIQNRSGDIKIEALNKLSQILIESSYSDTELNLHSPYLGSVYFNVTYGKLEQPFELNNATFTNESSTKTVEGSVGNENSVMRIKSRNGDVIIKQK